MPGQKRQLTVNGTISSPALTTGVVRTLQAVDDAMTTAAPSSELPSETRTSCEPEGGLDHHPQPAVVAGAGPMTAAASPLDRPVARALGASAGEQQEAYLRALSRVKNHMAQTLHETVLQTLVGTIYLAESPQTSRRDLVEHLRQASHELRAVIDDFAATETVAESATGG